MISKLESKYAKLDQLLQDTLRHCDGLNESQLRKRPEGKWNAVQLLYHLSTSEIGTTKYMQKKMNAKPSEVQKGGLKSFFRSVLLTGALKMHKTKFKAPKVLTEVPDSPDFEKTKLRLMNNREELVAILNQFDENTAKKAYFKHPLVGRLNVYQTLDFLIAHFERHAMQLKARSKA